MVKWARGLVLWSDPTNLLHLIVKFADAATESGMVHTTRPPKPPDLGIILVDHGSRREEANDLLQAVAAQFAQTSDFDIVEPAHMELAEPTLAAAFDRCVARGARQVLIHPYFLAPGRHSTEDIPALAAAAAAKHPGVSYAITRPLGLHPLMLRVIEDRVTESLRDAKVDSGSAGDVPSTV